MRTKMVPAVMLTVLGAMAGGCGTSGRAAFPPPPAAMIVDAKNVAFHPNSVSVHAGAVVAWRFDDGTIAHDVSGDGWRSPARTAGYYTHAFTAPGTYAYRCTIHTGMDGTVVVVP